MNPSEGLTENKYREMARNILILFPEARKDLVAVAETQIANALEQVARERDEEIEKLKKEKDELCVLMGINNGEKLNKIGSLEKQLSEKEARVKEIDLENSCLTETAFEFYESNYPCACEIKFGHKSECSINRDFKRELDRRMPSVTAKIASLSQKLEQSEKENWAFASKIKSLEQKLQEAVTSMKNCANPEEHWDLIKSLGDVIEIEQEKP